MISSRRFHLLVIQYHLRKWINTPFWVIRNESRASSVTTTDEMEHISQALQLNGYPRKLLQGRPALSRSGSSNPTEEPKWKSTAVIPYVHGVSESLRRILTSIKVRVCFRPAVTIKQLLSHPKDPTPDLQRSGVVYRIPCSDCPASYIGQTKRRLHQRIEEHKRAVRQADFNSSALAEHAWNHSHPIDWSNIKVLSNPRDTTTRLVEEAVAIRRTENTLNRDIGTLPTEYDNLF